MTTIDPIPRRKLSQEVTQRLGARIRAGEFRPGDHLPSERALMEAYGVGRPAVREALQRLERDGIVTITHGERARVAVPSAGQLIAQIAEGASHLLRLDPDNLDHLKDARLFLELGLVRRAAERADDPGIALLRLCLEEHVHALHNLPEFLPKDMAFHRQIAAMSGNPIFPAIIEAMFGWLAAYYRHLVRLRGAEDLTITEHHRIFAAIAARDADAAEAAMREHLTRANALYRDG
jgi:GntR family transcriptional regulator, sialic acid-inducible nan operon repressor